MMPDAAAVMAWLELLELPEMGGFVLLSSVLKQACCWLMYTPGHGNFVIRTSPSSSCRAESLLLAHHECRGDPGHGVSELMTASCRAPRPAFWQIGLCMTRHDVPLTNASARWRS